MAKRKVSSVDVAHFVKQFVLQRWFLLSLAFVLVGGIVGWQSLQPVAEARLLRNGVVAAVLFLMALPLPAERMWKAMQRPGPPLLGVVMNFIVAPLLSWGVSFGLREDMAGGLLVAAVTPTTLASAAVWTRRAGGNDAVAVLVTIVTNATCFLVTPFWLNWMLGSRAAVVRIDMADMVGRLAVLVVLPMVVAQLLRLYRPIGVWATHHSRPLTVLSQTGILTMVFIGAITAGKTLASQPANEAFSLLDWVLMIAAVLGVHLVILALGYWSAHGLGMRREDRLAVAFSGSQKTLMVGLQVALDCGLLILPMVVYHVGQLLVDTVIADRWRKQGERTLAPVSPM
jgi:sodium/bile acid cotransporter 7